MHSPLGDVSWRKPCERVTHIARRFSIYAQIGIPQWAKCHYPKNCVLQGGVSGGWPPSVKQNG
jgi:hypothetical protein